MSEHQSWVAQLIDDPARRARERRLASMTEAVFSLVAAALACLAVWAFTWRAPILGIDAVTVGGLSVLCFAACMAIAAGGGIRSRLIALIDVLDARQRPA